MSKSTHLLATSPISEDHSPLTAAMNTIEQSDTDSNLFDSQLQFNEMSVVQHQNSSSLSSFSTLAPNGIPIRSALAGSESISVSTLTDSTINGSNSHSPLVKNSPSDNIQNIFLAEKQPQWFVGRVLVKEFCIARKVWEQTFFNSIF